MVMVAEEAQNGGSGSKKGLYRWIELKESRSIDTINMRYIRHEKASVQSVPSARQTNAKPVVSPENNNATATKNSSSGYRSIRQNRAHQIRIVDLA